MAGFKTHFSTSSLVGVGYGVAGHFLGMPLGDCILAGTLCSFCGILPDLDSDSGVPVRETFAFLSAVVPMMLMQRLGDSGISPHSLIVVGIVAYLFMRFGVSKAFKRYTVHRGMWHSIPAAAIVGLAVYLLSYADSATPAIFNAAAAVLGFLTHLVLDEIWSIEVKKGRMRIKKSFGTALKFWSRRSLWANFTTYGKLAALIAIAVTQPAWLKQLHPHGDNQVRTATKETDERQQPLHENGTLRR